MNWEEKGARLAEIITPIYAPEYEFKIFKSIISSLYLQHFDIDNAEKVLYGLYDNLPVHGVSKSDILQLSDEIFAEETKPNGGESSLEDVFNVTSNTRLAKKAIRKITDVINVNQSKNHSFYLSDNTWIDIDFFNNEVVYRTLNNSKNDRVTTTSRVLLCRPYHITIYESPLKEGREFSITWISSNGKYFNMTSVTVSDIENELLESGYVVNPKYLKTTIAALVQIFTDNHEAEIKSDIEANGFYLSDDGSSLIKVGYETKSVNADELNESLLLIEDLKHFFIGKEDKLATTLKHGLIAPFGFAKKQLGLPLEYLIPYLYHYGKSGSGKTTIARIGLWFYERPQMDKNDIGGTEFDTVPRIGEQLKKSTFGLLVNEPETSLSKKSCAATLKTSVERTNARQKIRGNRMEQILALAMVSFASNIPLPNIEGLPRRFIQILYSYSEKKSDDEKKGFMSHFKLANPDECEFNKLQYLANFAVVQIEQDIDLLRLNWKDLGNELINRAYGAVGREVPEWLLEYVESVTDDDLDDEEIESIRMFILNQINRQSGQIKLYSSDDGRPISQEVFYTDEAKTSDDFEEKVWNVINEGLIPYAIARENKKNIREVCFLSGFKQALNDNNIHCYSLESTGELLGWQKGYLKYNGKSSRCIRVNFRTFLKFLYPSLEEEQ